MPRNTNRLALKIPALGGKDAETNRRVFEVLATKGPQTIYGINKLLGRTREQYPTINRAVNRLAKRGYLVETEKVRMEKRKTERTPKFGLSWRGFITCLVDDKARLSVLEVFDKNKHLPLPIDRDVAVPLATEALGQERIEKIAKATLKALVATVPRDLESIEDPPLFGCLLPALFELGRTSPKLLADINLNPSIFFKYPKVLKWIEENLIDEQTNKLEEQLRFFRQAKTLLSELKSKREGMG